MVRTATAQTERVVLVVAAFAVATIQVGQGQRVVRELAKQCDVLIENYKYGDLARYGLGYDELSKLNPKLVYCSITGFGQTGPDREKPGYDFMAQGIPITPMTDARVIDPYQLSKIDVLYKGAKVATTKAVVPVSWEITCNACHNTPGISVAQDILLKHDRLHGTSLVNQKPVLCAKCHADPALGAPGVTGISSLSGAMHTAHADRMAGYSGTAQCYTCHPGPKTQCFRDVHQARGMTCQSCHTSMEAVGSSSRRPWQDEPRCGDCHAVPGHQYEQPGVLYRDSVGHNGVKCITCHNSPHAITPTQNARDNVQATAIQGFAGTIKKCSVCHSEIPSDPFNHSVGDD